MKFGSLQLRTPDGEAREVPVDLPNLVVGRSDGNNIIIDDLSISRRHARLVIESGRLLIEDLGSAAGTFVAGHRIDPHTSNLVEGDAPIRFGDVEVRFVPAPAGLAEQATEDAADAAALDAYDPTPSSSIHVAVTSPSTPVEPGGAVFASAVIHNRGRVVDLVQVAVTGVPAAWVTFNRSTLALVPGTNETVTMVIQPPLEATALAGEYDFGVQVTSAEHDRESVAFGKLAVLPFDATVLTLQPMRSKRNFTLVAKNNGNALVTYTLGGVDDESAFLYDFHEPSIELRPGTEKRVPIQVRRPVRQWFGRTVFMPFLVRATPTAGTATAVQAPGQLVVQPPLEKWKWPAIVALMVAAIALAVWLSWVYRDKMPGWVPWAEDDAPAAVVAAGEAAYSGVHMCDKAEEERSAPKPVELPAGASGSPLFAQNNPAWAKVEYAHAGDPEFGPDWCGTTIEQCGCAMTSVTTIMAMFGIVTMPDGKEVTPETVNAWFNADAEKTNRGWVSRGYIYGDVIWAAANELSGQIAAQRPGSTTVRFAGFGTGSEDEIKQELEAGRPIILEVPGHYIAATGLDERGRISINDPYYSDRTTLDAYKGKVLSSVLFEPSNDLGGVVITVPKDLDVQVKDRQGKITGAVAGGTVSQDIPGSWVNTRSAWRDPTCVESPPPANAGTTSIFLPGTRDDYTVEVSNPGGGGSSVAIHSYDTNGTGAVKTQESTGNLTLALAYDPGKAAVETRVIAGTSPSASASPGTTPGQTPTLPGGSAGGAGSSSGTPAATETPEPSATPAPSATARPGATASATPALPVAPSDVAVKCDVAYSSGNAGVTCTGTVSGAYTTTRWTVNGVPAPVAPGATSLATTFTQDTAINVEMTACNVTVCKTGSVAVNVAFPAATPTPVTPTPAGSPTPTPTPRPVGPPPIVYVSCTAAAAAIDCSTAFTESYNAITWTATGASPKTETTGAKTFTVSPASPGTTTVRATVCLGSECTTSSPVQVVVGAQQQQLGSSWTLGQFADHYSSGDPIVLELFFADLVPANTPPPAGSATFYWSMLGDGGFNTFAFAPVTGTTAPQAVTTGTLPCEIPESGMWIAASYSGDANWAPWDGRTQPVWISYTYSPYTCGGG